MHDRVIQGIHHIVGDHLIFIDRISLAIRLKSDTLLELFHIVNLIHPLVIDDTKEDDTLNLTEGFCFRELSFLGIVEFLSLVVELLCKIRCLLNIRKGLVRNRLQRNNFK